MMVRLLTQDFPPRRGGAARYHAAVARALEASVTVADAQRPWRSYLPDVFALPRDALLVVGEVLPYGTLAWLRHLRTGAPYAVICHGLDLSLASRVPRKRWIATRVLRGAERLIVNSVYTAGLARVFGVAPARMTIVSPPIGVTPATGGGGEALRAAQRIGDRPLVLTVGRLIARKGFDTLIDAVARCTLDAGRVPIALVIVGDGPERAALERRAVERGVDLRIVPDADDAALAAWYDASDVFAMLPRELPNGDVEGFGIAYLEAGVFGKPVIGTRTGGVSEAIVDRETGFLIPPDDTAAAAAALTRLLTDRSLAYRLGAAGRTRGEREFNDARFVERIRDAVRIPHHSTVFP